MKNENKLSFGGRERDESEAALRSKIGYGEKRRIPMRNHISQVSPKASAVRLHVRKREALGFFGHAPHLRHCSSKNGRSCPSFYSFTEKTLP